MNISLRALRADDAPHLARIFFDAVHDGTAGHYTRAQRTAWAGDAPDPDGWRRKLDGMAGFIAMQGDTPVGFMTIDKTGLIDLAFVAPDMARQGIGAQLYEAVEDRARSLGVSLLTTDASKAAKPFFARRGWTVAAEQSVVRRGVELTNYKMHKVL